MLLTNYEIAFHLNLIDLCVNIAESQQFQLMGCVKINKSLKPPLCSSSREMVQILPALVSY